MNDSCPAFAQLLERYFDRQVTEEEQALVQRHLPVCSICQEKLRGLEKLREVVKSPVDEALRIETFPWLWEKIERDIRLEQKPTWQEAFLSWLGLSRLLRKKVWIPAVVTAVLITLIVSPFLLKKTPSLLEQPVVEYVESGVYNVMVYESEKAKVTVIWLFEEPPDESTKS